MNESDDDAGAALNRALDASEARLREDVHAVVSSAVRDAVREVLAATLRAGAGIQIERAVDGGMVISASGTGSGTAPDASDGDDADADDGLVPGDGDGAIELFDVIVVGTGAPAGTVLPWGHPFAPGRVPLGWTVEWLLADGERVETQFEVWSRWPDGSVKYAVGAVALPHIAADDEVVVSMVRVPVAVSSARRLSLADAAQTRSASVTIRSTLGDAAWTADLLDLVRTAPTWRRGTLLVEARVAVPVPHVVCGTSSMLLVADVRACADGTLWVDAWPANIAFDWPAPDAENAAVAMTVEIDGDEVAVERGLVACGAGPVPRIAAHDATRRTTVEPAFLRPNNDEFVAAGVSGWYPPTGGISPTRLASMRARMVDPDWSRWTTDGARTPLRGLIEAGPTGGNENLYGIPFGDGAAAWMRGAHPDTWRYALGQAEAMCAQAHHWWDQRAGRWINHRDRPDLRAWSTDRDFVPGWSRAGTFRADGAHMPMVQILPALLTGRRVLCDSLIAYAHARAADGYHTDALNRRLWAVSTDQQIRTVGYTMASLVAADFISRDDDPWLSPGWLRESLEANIGYHVARIPGENATYGDLAGALRHQRGDYGPWQMALVIEATAMAARQRIEGAPELLAWFRRRLVREWLEVGPDWPLNAVAYWQPSTDATGAPIREWPAFQMATQAAVTPQAARDKDQNYVRSARMALTMLAAWDPGDAEVRAALAALEAVGFRGTTDDDLRSYPRQGIAIPPDTP